MWLFGSFPSNSFNTWLKAFFTSTVPSVEAGELRPWVIANPANNIASFAVLDGGEDDGLAALVFYQSLAHVWDIGAGQGMLWPLSMAKQKGLVWTRLCERGKGGRAGGKRRRRGPGKSDRRAIVVKFIALVAVEKQTRILDIVMCAVVEVAIGPTVLIVPIALMMSSAVISVPVIIVSCIPTS